MAFEKLSQRLGLLVPYTFFVLFSSCQEFQSTFFVSLFCYYVWLFTGAKIFNKLPLNIVKSAEKIH